MNPTRRTSISSISTPGRRATASASELLALGLRTYLPNATVVGRTTLGKGFGQQAFMDDERRIAVFAVNF